MPAPFLNPNDPQVHLVQEYGPYGYQPKLAPAVVFTVGEWADECNHCLPSCTPY